MDSSATYVVGTGKEVNNVNNFFMKNELKNRDCHIFHATQCGIGDFQRRSYLSLELKKGCRVQATSNTVLATKKVVHQTYGTVVDFQYCRVFDGDEAKGSSDLVMMCPVVQFDTGYKGAVPPITFYSSDRSRPTRRQFPLRLAFAITGHSIQGSEIRKGSKLVTHTTQISGPAFLYVFCGRAQTLDDIFFIGDVPDFRKAARVSQLIDSALKFNDRLSASDFRHSKAVLK